jgi:hypothetical protein
MISTQDNDIKTLVTALARTLSPTGKVRRNDIARRWLFDNSAWAAEEVYDGGDPKRPVGVRLTSPEFDERSIASIEYALALLMGQKFSYNDCVLIDEQFWGDEHPYKSFDCGYETTYKFKDDTLKITVRHQSSSRMPRGRKSTAVAAIRRRGTTVWKTLYELKGERIRSRDEVQYREKRDYEPPNAHLFHQDEQELFYRAMSILQD